MPTLGKSGRNCTRVAHTLQDCVCGLPPSSKQPGCSWCRSKAAVAMAKKRPWTDDVVEGQEVVCQAPTARYPLSSLGRWAKTNIKKLVLSHCVLELVSAWALHAEENPIHYEESPL